MTDKSKLISLTPISLPIVWRRSPSRARKKISNNPIELAQITKNSKLRKHSLYATLISTQSIRSGISNKLKSNKLNRLERANIVLKQNYISK